MRAEGGKCCREGNADQTCCPQPAQRRADVACPLHAHALLYCLPGVSQQVPSPGHFSSVSLLYSILFYSTLPLLQLWPLICRTSGLS